MFDSDSSPHPTDQHRETHRPEARPMANPVGPVLRPVVTSSGRAGTPDFRTDEQRAADALLVGAPLVAADIIAGRPATLGTVKLKRKPGRPRGRRYAEKISVPFDKDLLELIDAASDAEHLSRSALIRALCREALDRRAEQSANSQSAQTADI